jgi:hypothetical protein
MANVICDHFVVEIFYAAPPEDAVDNVPTLVGDGALS